MNRLLWILMVLGTVGIIYSKIDRWMSAPKDAEKLLAAQGYTKIEVEVKPMLGNWMCFHYQERVNFKAVKNNKVVKGFACVGIFSKIHLENNQ